MSRQEGSEVHHLANAPVGALNRKYNYVKQACHDNDYRKLEELNTINP